ncbi:uncharacterized protein LOC115625420 [Scaptodrosophila lebanonensis]|uniref:Uncharacterized protein LOC115625420 n=1 Tax=Drosophila lebanonensis TaxID=7225 RepID=A0A6J2TLD3_DROLE|nr:uncharacterized protein LOC115625420 [Scaptodrosophila lebanonensis]
MNHQVPLALLMLLLCGAAVVEAYTNTTFHPGSQELATLKRSKRVAIFDGLGVSKFVFGVAHPAKLPDKKQSFWWFYVLQWVYTPTTIPLYWWSFWNTSTFVSTAREWRMDLQTTLRDEARSWVYDIIETSLENLDSNKKGATCLLRAICEISRLPFDEHHVFGELLNAILVPKLDNVSEKYLHARDAGRAGADCSRNYVSCSRDLWQWIQKMTTTF